MRLPALGARISPAPVRRTGTPDFPTLKVIRSYRGVSAEGELLFGVYGDVVEPGAVRVGDEVELLD